MKTLIGSLVIAVIACVACIAIESPDLSAQIVVGEGGGGRVVSGGQFQPSPIYGWLGDLKDDEKWESASEQLVKKARDGERFEVIFACESYKRIPDETVQTRVKHVFAELEEAGLYPVTPEDVKTMIQKARVTLDDLEQKNTTGQVPATSIRTLYSCNKMLQSALSGCKTEE